MQHLITHTLAQEAHVVVRGVSAGALEVLTRYDWLGNVREMENIIQRSIVLAAGPVVQLQDLPLDLAMPDTGSRSPEDEGLPLREAREQFEQQYVLRVLERVAWNQSRAARLLGLHRNTLLAKLAAWGIRYGSTHLVLDPLERLEQLCVCVPAPRTHVRRYHGVLAPHAAWRSLIVPRRSEGAGSRGE